MIFSEEKKKFKILRLELERIAKLIDTEKFIAKKFSFNLCENKKKFNFCRIAEQRRATDCVDHQAKFSHRDAEHGGAGSWGGQTDETRGAATAGGEQQVGSKSNLNLFKFCKKWKSVEIIQRVSVTIFSTTNFFCRKHSIWAILIFFFF